MIVSETMLQRERLRRDVKALTAEGRISAIVLALLPVILGLRDVRHQPRLHAAPCSTTTVGQLLILGGIVLALIGFFWMKKVIEIEV